MIKKWISSRRRAYRHGDDRVLSVGRDLIGLALLAAILVGLEAYRSEQLQDRRSAEQERLLEGMESLRNPAVSEVVRHWRLAYPEPNDDRLAELRDLAGQVQADPASLLGSPAATAGAEDRASRGKARASSAAPAQSLPTCASKEGS